MTRTESENRNYVKILADIRPDVFFKPLPCRLNHLRTHFTPKTAVASASAASVVGFQAKVNLNNLRKDSSSVVVVVVHRRRLIAHRPTASLVVGWGQELL
jgi:hypothetical protein